MVGFTRITGWLREIWPIVRLFATKFGQQAYDLAKILVQQVQNDPVKLDWTDEQKRNYVIGLLVTALKERYGHVPGFNWVIQMAVQFAVGWLRQQLKKE